MAEPDADFETLMEEMGHLQEKIDAADAWAWPITDGGVVMNTCT